MNGNVVNHGLDLGEHHLSFEGSDRRHPNGGLGGDGGDGHGPMNAIGGEGSKVSLNARPTSRVRTSDGQSDAWSHGSSLPSPLLGRI